MNGFYLDKTKTDATARSQWVSKSTHKKSTLNAFGNQASNNHETYNGRLFF